MFLTKEFPLPQGVLEQEAYPRLRNGKNAEAGFGASLQVLVYLLFVKHCKTNVKLMFWGWENLKALRKMLIYFI